MSNSDNTPQVERTRVVVIGGGIAGLTAAQELVERNFEVEVVECMYSPTDSDGDQKPDVLVGGMARTQYADAPSFETRGNGTFFELKPTTLPYLSVCVETASDSSKRASSDESNDLTQVEKNRIAALFEQGERSNAGQHEVVVAGDSGGKRYETVLAHVSKLIVEPRNQTRIVRLDDKSLGDSIVVSLRLSRVPAEHGMRFFPSFYRHMYDTMRRIPNRVAVTRRGKGKSLSVTLGDAADSVFTNLLPAPEFHFGVETGRSWSIRRRRPNSIEEMRTTLGHLLDDMGYDPTEAAKLTATLVKYMVTSRERRQGELETETWTDYVQAEKFVSRLGDHLQSAPQILAAMNAEDSEARTIGSTTMQLLADQFREAEFVDSVLNAPTSESLFIPWKMYLESQGVTFTAGSLQGFQGFDHGKYVRPSFSVVAGHAAVAPADYYIVTIPVNEFQKLLPTTGDPNERLLSRTQVLEASRHWCQKQRDLGFAIQDDVQRYLSFPQANPATPDSGPMRNMVGIQFYFDSDPGWVQGHVMLSDSPWGIALVSQRQFWASRSRVADGYLGIISATVTRFDVPGVLNPLKRGKDCTSGEFAREVWHQIVSTLGSTPTEEPALFYIDDGVKFHPDKPNENETPYLVNRAGEWESRGGRRVAGDYVYDLQMGRIVFAGVFMRSHTRLTSMECANETARRAVNAILDATDSKARRCQIFDIEAHEWADGKTVRDLDKRLWEQGGRHPFDSAVLDAVMDIVPWKFLRWLRR